MEHDESIIYEKTYRLLTPDLHQRCDNMVNREVTEYMKESPPVYRIPV